MLFFSNKINPKSISRFLSWVKPSIALSQDILNLPLFLHSNTSSLRALSSRPGSLKLYILFFFSIHKLHLLLHLIAVEDSLIIFHFIWGVTPKSLSYQKYSDRAVWFLSHGYEKVCLWLYSPCFQIPVKMPMYTLPILLCSIGEMHAWYTTFSELHRPPKWHSSFLLQFQGTLSVLYSCLIRLIVS